MAHRNIIVVGASLGGVTALPQLMAGLSPDLHAAVLVVIHRAANSPGFLEQQLDRVSPLRAAAAVDGEEVEPGRIYVAAPDRHLLIEGSRVRLSRGPRESHARPAIDALFRSAAYYHGPRVIGVVLTGLLDDGTAGLWAIKDRGGVAIVQSPDEAPHPSMPLSALQHVDIDHTLPIAEMPEVLLSLTRETLHRPEAAAMNENIEIETRIAMEDNALLKGVRALGQPSFYTCPECHGSMVAIQEGTFRRFRCHTGHAFSSKALLEGGLPQIEKTLWAALAQLEEHEVLLSEMERQARQQSRPGEAAEYVAQGVETRLLVEQVRALALDPALGHSAPDEQAEEPSAGAPDLRAVKVPAPGEPSSSPGE